MNNDDLKQELLEGDEYLVVGAVYPKDVAEVPGFWARVRGKVGYDPNQGERWAQLYRANSARQAEDLARAAVRQKNENFRLFVAGVVDLDPDGHLRMADQDYAQLVDPDAEIMA